MLAVQKQHRKRGLAKELVRQEMAAMKRAKVDEVVLETELSNQAAINLYEQFGFTRDKLLCRYYLNGGDAFRLKWHNFDSA